MKKFISFLLIAFILCPESHGWIDVDSKSTSINLFVESYDAESKEIITSSVKRGLESVEGITLDFPSFAGPQFIVRVLVERDETKKDKEMTYLKCNIVITDPEFGVWGDEEERGEEKGIEREYANSQLWEMSSTESNALDGLSERIVFCIEGTLVKPIEKLKSDFKKDAEEEEQAEKQDQSKK